MKIIIDLSDEEKREIKTLAKEDYGSATVDNLYEAVHDYICEELDEVEMSIARDIFHAFCRKGA